MKPPARVADASTRLDLERKMADYRARRDRNLWNIVVGIALLFTASIAWQLALGGVAMVLFGAANYARWNRRMTKIEDPWDDPEIDAWEAENFPETPEQRRND